MAPASMFTIVTIPKQFNDDALLRKYIDKYRELRLRSLKSDPDAFSSTFADESKETFEFWKGRMLVPKARHFMAVRSNNASNPASKSDYPHAVLETEWVGTLVLLGPRAVARDDESPWKTFARGRFVEDDAEANSESVASAYHLAGLYIAPETRGQGLGSFLVHTAMEVIAHDRQKMYNASAICTVGTSHTNLVVRRLFKTTGFVEVAEELCNTTDGRCLVEIVLHRDFFR